MKRRAAAGVLVVVTLSCFGCAEVAAHERGRLAHPTMAPDDDSSLAREHLHALHEGAAGGRVETSSGCGCN